VGSIPAILDITLFSFSKKNLSYPKSSTFNYNNKKRYKLYMANLCNTNNATKGKKLYCSDVAHSLMPLKGSHSLDFRGSYKNLHFSNVQFVSSLYLLTATITTIIVTKHFLKIFSDFHVKDYNTLTREGVGPTWINTACVFSYYGFHNDSNKKYLKLSTLQD
jgi:hypothetical protein